MREAPDEPDEFDSKRVEYARDLWRSQDQALLSRDRQVEENVRMLAGQQWIVWNDRFRRFVDVIEVLSDEQRRYKQRPVVNRLAFWFVLNHARMTENPPIVGFQPSSEDSIDAELARAMDGISKSLWDDLEMVSVRSLLEAWRLVGGCAYLYTHVDPTKGDVREYMGTALVRGINAVTGQEEDFLVVDDEGNPARVPFNRDEGGELVPQATVNDDGSVDFGEPLAEHEGGITVDVLGPLEVRGEWGSNIPWNKKSWHERVSYMTPDQVKQTWGVEVPADPSIISTGVGQLERILRGTGLFGAAKENVQLGVEQSVEDDPSGLVLVYDLWVRPGTNGAPHETSDSPGGRRLIVTDNGHVIYDGPRPAKFRYTSPIRRFDMVMTPGAPHGRSPMEWLNPLQRLYNRTWAIILEHNNLVANPIMVTDANANIPDITNRPGARYQVVRRPGVPAIEFVAPPRLSDDVYNQLGLISDAFDDLGNIVGAEGRIPHDDASGALMQELRFNSDRFLGTPLRQGAEEFGRFWEDVLAIIAELWDEDKMLTWLGEDQVLSHTTVSPELFQGRVNAKPDLESMLPESRKERQSRAVELWQAGFFGDPASEEARARFSDLARFPHMGRLFKPGGHNWETARYIMGLIAKGDVGAEEVTIYPFYDLGVWIGAAEQYMSKPEFTRMDPAVQDELVKFHEILVRAAMAKAIDEGETQAIVEAATRVKALEANLQSGGPQLEAAAASALQPSPEGADVGASQGPPPIDAGVAVQSGSAAPPPEIPV